MANSGPVAKATKAVACICLQAAVLHPSFAALPDSYSGARFSGRVVDGNGSPISGAVVVASWTIAPTFFFHGPTKFKVIYLAETVTDADGKYSIAEWGPVPRPSGWAKYGSWDPSIGVFKPGFVPVALNNVAWQTEMQTGPPFNSPEVGLLSVVHDEKDIVLSSYGEYERAWVPNSDSSIKTDARRALVGRLESFASFLDRNVAYSDDGEASSTSPERIKAMQLQRNAVLTIDEELKTFGVRFNWLTGIRYVSRTN